MNAPDSALPPDAGWQPLPARARALLMLDMLPRALPAAVPAFVLAVYLGAPRWTTGAACIAAAVLFALWLGARAHRYARWRL
ncbi:MAG TPA: hypothetical protein VEY50_08635, partial [Lysobacter sp.]|nr:hypothetical protein [Lysobacter sp.]